MKSLLHQTDQSRIQKLVWILTGVGMSTVLLVSLLLTHVTQLYALIAGALMLLFFMLLGLKMAKIGQQIEMKLSQSNATLKKEALVRLRVEEALRENEYDLSERTENLCETKDQMKKTLMDMERMNVVMMGREKRIIEMKCEVNDLQNQLGKVRKYRHV